MTNVRFCLCTRLSLEENGSPRLATSDVRIILRANMMRMKIEKQQSVTGISGMCMIMYALVYFLRLIMVVPNELSLIFIDEHG